MSKGDWNAEEALDRRRAEVFMESGFNSKETSAMEYSLALRIGANPALRLDLHRSYCARLRAFMRVLGPVEQERARATIKNLMAQVADEKGVKAGHEH